MRKTIARKIGAKAVATTTIKHHPKRKPTTKREPSLQLTNYLLEDHPELLLISV